MGSALRRWAAILMASMVLLVACGGTSDPEFTGSVLDNPYSVPDLALTDTDGEQFSLAADTDKRLTLVFFGYTHCPDICPMVMNSLAGAMTRLDEADREQVDVVFVTTDPERDTEKVLRSYLDRLDPEFIGLTGDLATIVDVGEPLAVYVADGEKLPTGGYDLGGHTTTVLAVDGEDQTPVYWSQDTSAFQYATDIHTLLQKDS